MNSLPVLQGVDEGFAWFESYANLERSGDYSQRNYQLHRMRALAEAAGHPETRFQSIHVAGSKGKGSTAALIASVLDHHGLATGLYTSPHVSDYRERISLAGRFFPDEVLLESMRRTAWIIRHRDRRDDPPSTFELLTLCAFLTFTSWGCPWAAVETGLGGRLDSTNIITPEACVLTPVELEHTDVLGSTLAEIAGEKAGIIKPGVPVFMGIQRPEAEEVFRRRARELGAPFYSLAEEVKTLRTTSKITGTEVELTWRTGENFRCPLSFSGGHQGENAALAALCLKTLASSGTLEPLPEKDLAVGLSRAHLPGRFEILETSPPFILDAAHTRASVERTLRTLREMTEEPGILLFGAVSGKDIRSMASVLAPAFDRIIISRPGVFKKSDSEETFRMFSELHPRVYLEVEPEAALALARDLAAGRLPLLITGSFYMAAEIRKALLKENRAKDGQESPGGVQ